MATAAMEFVATMRARAQKIAETGEVEITDWPETHKFLIRLFEHIVVNEFPLPPPLRSSSPSPSPSHAPPRVERIPHNTDQRKTAGDTTTTTSSVCSPKSTTPSLEQPGPNNPSDETCSPSKEWSLLLPYEALEKCEWIYSCLKKNFSNGPPCTVQRLVELLLSPRAYYRHLPPYLNAIDRLVSVSPPELIFLDGEEKSSRFAHLEDTHTGAHLEPIQWLEPDHTDDCSVSDLGSSFPDENSRDLHEMPDLDSPVDDKAGLTSTTNIPALNTDLSHQRQPQLDHQILDQSTAEIDGEGLPAPAVEQPPDPMEISPSPDSNSSLFSKSSSSPSLSLSDATHSLHSDEIASPVELNPFSISFEKHAAISPELRSDPEFTSAASPSPPDDTVVDKAGPTVASTSETFAQRITLLSHDNETDSLPSTPPPAGGQSRKRPASTVLDTDSSVSPRIKMRCSSVGRDSSPKEENGSTSIEITAPDRPRSCNVKVEEESSLAPKDVEMAESTDGEGAGE